MQNLQHIIGADLSKKTIDLFCQSHFKIENNLSGFKQMLKWFKGQKISAFEVMIVMEHTGLYSYLFEDFLHKHQIAFSKVSALAVKRSLGLIRGKSDKLDAKRLADYGFEKRTKLTVETQVSKELQRLQFLHSTRERIVGQKASLMNSLKEYRNIGLTSSDSIVRTQMNLIRQLEKAIGKLQAEMDAIIEKSPCIKQNQSLLQSIIGVGKVLSVAAIIKTRNFTRFPNARKFACYCGTAPFEHSSGTSIKGKTRVSHLADKAMKTLLDLSAKSAIQYDKELREYYLRRTASGKSKMSTINIVRNKILYRMFAVVKRQTPFVEHYLPAA